MVQCQIGLDIRMIKHTGIGTYLQGLVTSFKNEEIRSGLDLRLFGGTRQEMTEGFSRHPFRSRIYSVEEQLEYPLRLARCRLWHAPHYNIPVFKGKTKLVVTVHDLIHWIFRRDFFTPLQSFYVEKMLTRVVELADHIVTVSHKTREDLIRHFNADPERISVIYEAAGERFRPAEAAAIADLKCRYGLPENYFLYVGSLKPHKNVLWLVRLFKKLKAQGKIDASLVLIGRKDRRYPNGYESLARFKSDQDVIHLSYVGRDELPVFYSGAVALIHPSLYEGFGLTLLEAMACGTPVIACRSASIPEVAGDAAYLVDSCAENEMMDAIVRMEKFSDLREKFSRKGTEHVRRFRWEETAKKTAEIYDHVLGQS